MVKTNKTKKHSNPFSIVIRNIIFGSVLAVIISLIIGVYFFEYGHKTKIYPGVKIDSLDVGGRTREEVLEYFDKINKPFDQIELNLQSEGNTATISGKELNVSYDSNLATEQAFSIGRSGHSFSDIYQKIKAANSGLSITRVLRMNTDIIDDTLNNLANNIDVQPQDALFQFENGKVINFKPSQNGKKLNKEKAKKLIKSAIDSLIKDYLSPSYIININLPIEEVLPAITTDNSNTFGIRELIGVGTSKFAGSIPGRIHNIELGASRIHGHLIPPGSEFSFNETIGDISASTGFQPAYIIKEGRTVLGDGGGVCQISTTIFRAALNAGLPITERHAHAYRVSYYEQDVGPGLDATVYSPSYDLKFKNDTQNYLLIHAKTDIANYSLAFEIYGTKDGRVAEVSKPVIMSQVAPPPDLFEDDPTLPIGVVKQVDWKAWGAKVTFDYKVVKDNQILTKDTFFSNYQPWKSVFLRGTRS